MKKLTITKCNMCPHFETRTSLGDEVLEYCGFTPDKLVQLVSDETIPGFCPLDDDLNRHELWRIILVLESFNGCENDIDLKSAIEKLSKLIDESFHEKLKKLAENTVFDINEHKFTMAEIFQMIGIAEQLKRSLLKTKYHEHAKGAELIADKLREWVAIVTGIKGGN